MRADARLAESSDARAYYALIEKAYEQKVNELLDVRASDPERKAYQLAGEARGLRDAMRLLRA